MILVFHFFVKNYRNFKILKMNLILPIDFASLNNRFQSTTKIPLLMGIDGEWGLAMRVNSTMAFHSG